MHNTTLSRASRYAICKKLTVANVTSFQLTISEIYVKLCLLSELQLVYHLLLPLTVNLFEKVKSNIVTLICENIFLKIRPLPTFEAVVVYNEFNAYSY